MHGETANMEYLSMAHTRASTLHLVPRVNDVLVSNLREPMLTLIEDSSPGIHDTLIPACDPQRYKAIGVENWEQHGSCAENLVLALKELNDRAGLKGPKGVGASVTVNSVPAPLNLFMNIPWQGDKGELSFEAPKGKEGDYVRLRAERDVVVIMSACPNDVQEINKGQSKDGHFLVEHADDSSDEEKPVKAKKSDKKKPRKLNANKKDDPKSDEQKAKADAPKDQKTKDDKPPTPKDDKPEEQKKAENVPLPATPAIEKPEPASTPAPSLSSTGQATPKPKGKPRKLVDSSTGEKKKPRKLESRAKGGAASTPKSGSGSATPAKQEDASAGADKGGS